MLPRLPAPRRSPPDADFPTHACHPPPSPIQTLLTTPSRLISTHLPGSTNTPCPAPAGLPQGAPARVVALTSFGHNFAKGLPMDDLNWETRPYSAWPAYGQSKLSNALFAVELARRWALCWGRGAAKGWQQLSAAAAACAQGCRAGLACARKLAVSPVWPIPRTPCC
jgi:hypothetical protein